MHVKHSSPYTEKVGHGGREYTALREGIFNVPDHVGHELLAQPGWTRYQGEAPYEISSAASGAEETDWYDEGRKAAEADEPRSLPQGMHGRSKDGRDFFRGYDSVKKEAAPAE